MVECARRRGIAGDNAGRCLYRPTGAGGRAVSDSRSAGRRRRWPEQHPLDRSLTHGSPPPVQHLDLLLGDLAVDDAERAELRRVVGSRVETST